METSAVRRLYRRRYLLVDAALELILIGGTSYLFIFDDADTRDLVYSLLVRQCKSLRRAPSLAALQAMWQRREITNAEYLMSINFEAGRSLNDLTQYPVFPHIIAGRSQIHPVHAKPVKISTRIYPQNLSQFPPGFYRLLFEEPETGQAKHFSGSQQTHRCARPEAPGVFPGQVSVDGPLYPGPVTT